MGLLRSKIKLGSYPYVNARVRAMRSKLLSSNDYRKAMNMSLAEINEFLQQQDYRDEINEYASDHDGADLLEIALRQNLANTYQKLIEISPETVETLLQAYFQKFDVENIKTIVRKKLNEKHADIDPLLIPTDRFDDDALRRLQDMSVEEILQEVKLGAQEPLSVDIDEPDDLAAIEHELDRRYYSSLQETADRLPSDGKLFKEFLGLELERRNIGLILRMQRQGYDETTIRDNLITMLDQHDTSLIEELLEAEDYEAAIEHLKTEDIGQFITNDDLPQVERALDRYKLDRGTTMLHKHPLSINPILGYMISKEAEIENLRIIMQAKRTGLGNEFIEDNIIQTVIER
ncbi:MAG: ATP synthase A1 subunit C [Candidatus Nanohaloarchaeota archaeon QJJ-5]|nr:ATP synthase A1 subunit C [Candidatus Nanohaloarchaeota archaeon QJJ-5]